MQKTTARKPKSRKPPFKPKAQKLQLKQTTLRAFFLSYWAFRSKAGFLSFGSKIIFLTFDFWLFLLLIFVLNFELFSISEVRKKIRTYFSTVSSFTRISKPSSKVGALVQELIASKLKLARNATRPREKWARSQHMCPELSWPKRDNGPDK